MRTLFTKPTLADKGNGMVQESSELVLIDDDELIRAAWTMVARSRGEKLRCFASYPEFLMAGVETTARVYVDLQLGEGVDGIEVAKELVSKGYRDVYLTTGMPIKGQLPEEIRGVNGKDYPSGSD